MKEEGFFRPTGVTNGTVDSMKIDDEETCLFESEESGSQNQDIGLILTITTSVLGVGLLFHGFVRDYISFGLCRLEMYIILSLSYLLMAISKPGESDYLQEFRTNLYCNTVRYCIHWCWI